MSDPPLRALLGAVALMLLLWGITTETRLGLAGDHLAALILLAVSTISWVGWLTARHEGSRRGTLAALVVMAAAGGALAAFAPLAITFVGAAAMAAASTFELPLASALAALGPISLLVATWIHGGSFERVLGATAAALVGVIFGISRRQVEQSARQAALIVVERERAEIEHTRAELLAERNRLAREIHDVLAHTLGALAVQLEALEVVVASGEAEAPALQEGLRRTRGLVRDGLDDARRAVRALRDDASPLPDQLAGLCEARGARLATSGAPRQLTPEITLALYRVAQEALTNAAKHAPGAPVTVQLDFAPDSVTLGVINGRAANAPLEIAEAGAGYGLQGMRERLLLLGGQVEANPAGDGWLVQARVPA